MPLETLAEADLYSTNDVFAGVVDEIIEDSPIFTLLPFAENVGIALQYLRENTLPSGEFFNPGDTWTEDTPEVSQITVALKILGKDADVDKFLAATRSNISDLEAEALAGAAKGVMRTFTNALFYEAVADNPKGWDGLHTMVTAGQKVAAGTTTAGGPGTFQKLDQAIDLCLPRPDALIMTRRDRRGIRTLARSQGWDLALSAVGSINKPILHYSDIPILVDDNLTITEDVVDGVYSAESGDDASTIFCVRFGDDGLHAITNGGLQIEEVGTLETKDAIRRRIKFYAAPVLKSTKAVSILSGIDDQAWTN